MILDLQYIIHIVIKNQFNQLINLIETKHFCQSWIIILMVIMAFKTFFRSKYLIITKNMYINQNQDM